MMPFCHCTRCHGIMHLVAVTGDDEPVAFLCQLCFYIWQINIGWNPWTARHDPEILEPRFA